MVPPSAVQRAFIGVNSLTGLIAREPFVAPYALQPAPSLLGPSSDLGGE
ncbi:hypothetical protein BH10PSE2_BH10PSE2_27780 [soil metagenome]